MIQQNDLLGTVRFTLRADKTKKDGKAPIQIIYSLHGQRKKVNTRLDIFPCQWEADQQKAMFIPKKESKAKAPDVKYNLLMMAGEVQTFNTALANWRERIKSIENILPKPFSSTDLTEYIKGEDASNKRTKKEEPKNFLADFITFHIDSTKAISNAGSQKVYRTLVKTIKEYEKKKRTRVTLENADYAFMQSFYNFCVETKKYVNHTSIKKLTCIKTMLKTAAVKYGYPTNTSYVNFSVQRDNLEVIALTEKEFNSIVELDLTGNKRLDRVRDIFVFSCATGLRYSDLENLKRENIKDGFIKIIVKKTREALKIPITPIPHAILKKYSQMLTPLPVISNQKTNAALKDLCKLAEINETMEIVRFRGKERVTTVLEKWQLISTHTGRKTFVTLSLSRGMSAQDVMGITGHKSYASFKRYVDITEDQKVKAMADIWGDAKMRVAK